MFNYIHENSWCNITFMNIPGFITLICYDTRTYCIIFIDIEKVLNFAFFCTVK